MKRLSLIALLLVLTAASLFAERQPKAVFVGNNVIFYYDDIDHSEGVTSYYDSESVYWTPGGPWTNWGNDVVKVAIFDSSFNEYKPTDLSKWFQGFEDLEEIVGLEYLDTSDVTSMYRMFECCHSLKHLDLSNFDTSSCTSMSQMFYDCRSLQSLTWRNIDLHQMSSYMVFEECKSLKEIDFSGAKFSGNNYIFFECLYVQSINLSNCVAAEGTGFNGMFESCVSLQTVNFSNCNTTGVTSMRGMFYGCQSLKSLDLNSLDSQNVTDMSYMFYGCDSLQSLDLCSFYTQNVTDMRSMFAGCESLESLNISSFNTENVTNMNAMFKNCHRVRPLNVSNFNTGNVTDMSSMFEGCWYVPEEFSNFDTRKVTTMKRMFRSSYPGHLDLRGFDTSNVTDMSEMFDDCFYFYYVDLSSFDTRKVTNMEAMFRGCFWLDDPILYSFDTQNVTNMSEMFENCTELRFLDLSKFDTHCVTDMSNMFAACFNLRKIFASETFITTNVSNSGGMFSMCNELSGAIRYEQADDIDASYANYETGFFTYSNTTVARLNDMGLATYSSEKDVKVKEGATAYIAAEALGQIVCQETENIPAATGVILKGKPGEFVTFQSGESGSLSQNGLLPTTLADGSLAPIPSTGYTFVLSGDKFKKYTGSKFSAHKAYFNLSYDPTVSGSGAPMRLTFNDATDIQDITEQNESAAIYNLNGTRAHKASGLSVVNGHLQFNK